MLLFHNEIEDELIRVIRQEPDALGPLKFSTAEFSAKATSVFSYLEQHSGFLVKAASFFLLLAAKWGPKSTLHSTAEFSVFGLEQQSGFLVRVASYFFCSLQQSTLQIKKTKNQLIYIQSTMEAKRATLEEIGLRSEKGVAKHILQENVWESHLIPDIAGVDYFAGHQGRTNLQHLEGLRVFVDDFYVYGPLRKDRIVRVRGRQA